MKKYYINIKCACGTRIKDTLSTPNIRECPNCGLDIIPVTKQTPITE